MKPLYLLLISALFSSTALAGVDPSNQFKMGDAGTGADKVIQFNRGLGSANPRLRSKASDGSIQVCQDGTTCKTLNLGSDITSAITTKTAAYTLTLADDVVLASNSGSTYALTLPLASAATGHKYYVKKTDANTNYIAIAPTGSDTLDGRTEGYELAVQNADITLVSNGSAWFKLAHHNAWKVDANIFGANVSLGTSAVTSYQGITDAGLTLANNTTDPAVLTAQIPCSTTNPPTGTTCAAGSESLGVSFTLPKGAAGVMVYMSALWNSVVGSSGQVGPSLEIVQTGNSDQTVAQEANDHPQNFNAAASGTNLSFEFNPHGELYFTTGGQKTIRLFYQQQLAGTVSQSLIIADRAGSGSGNRDVHIQVVPID